MCHCLLAIAAGAMAVTVRASDVLDLAPPSPAKPWALPAGMDVERVFSGRRIATRIRSGMHSRARPSRQVDAMSWAISSISPSG